MNRLHNFSAGPGALPLEVLLEVKEELPVLGNTGASVMEISHRSPAYKAINENAMSLTKKLLGLGDDWHVLFLQGGASMQFLQVPFNFLKAGQTASYLNTGVWSKKSIKEAKSIGNVHIVASSEGENFNQIPDPSTWSLNPEANYLHYTSNNTIFGTEFHFTPNAEQVPLVCDASSNFLSRPIEHLDRFGLIYAGAQKNIGPAGATAVLIREDFLQKRNSGTPTLLDYGTHIGDLYNTPPVFAVYIIEKVLRWLDNLGGLEAMEKRNIAKASKLYNALDASDFYCPTAVPHSRSRMNVTFRLADESLEAKFVSDAKAAGLTDLKGHRSVGGMRASIYNACPEASVDALVAFMQEFERTNG
jgi:phosphoserine aminotransferase